MSIEQNIENLEIRNANVVTFVGTSSTVVDTISGRIQCKGFQHNSNVITDVSGPHGRGAAVLKKYPEIAFEKGKFDYNDSTNTYVQAGYTVSASSFNPAQEPYRAFDYSGAGGGSLTWTTSVFTNLYGGGDGLYGTVQTSNLGLDSGGASTPQGGTRQNGEWIKIQMPNKIIVSRISISRIDDDTTASPEDFQLYGSNDGTTWVQILSETGASPSITGTSYTPISTPVAYKYFGLVVTRTTGRTNYMTINDLVFYGYEEDPPAGDHSVDTTFKSRFNNPQLTGVQVFVDGKGSGSNQIAGGPTVTDTVESYDETGKYWNLTGELTSNISVEANTFLEGDQPHAVSVWFNSSNLEANVSNTCVFSISDQEKLDSVNLDLQSNTWHNLTYSYQGEGGSRVTYLDGRKVAEEPAEDTFGDYPPFPMTGYSQGGYVVSSNSEKSGNQAWEAFDSIEYGDASGEGWETDTGTYSTVNDMGAISGETIIDTGGGQHIGHWIKIEFPQRIRIDYARLQAQNSANQPKSYVHLFSNNDQDWDLGYTHTTGDWAQAGPDLRKDVINTTKYYKYAMILVKSIRNTGGTCRLHEIGYYGHRENDLVRLPDPTNVLKYPHIAMTGPAQRGYVASASGAPASGAYESYHGFNGLTVSGYGSWHSESSYATSSTRESTTSTLSSWTGGGGGHNGAWLKIQLPHKLVLSSINIRPRTNPTYYHQHPRLFSIVGSNDDTNWYLVHEETTRSYNGATGPPLPDEHTMTGAYASTAWKYFAIVIRTGSTDNIYDHVSIGDWELYGTEEGSVPIQIGGGNIDKVANFRVYDKFVGEDQALEIWNAQKEEFGRAKPQMVLQQGKLGIGTDAPQGSLSVADEPHAVEEFPPRAMTGYETYMEGHGVFKASASEEYSKTIAGNASGDEAWKNFDKGFTNWTGGASYTGTNNTYQGTHSTGGYGGDYIELKLPYKIKLQEFIIQPSPGLLNRWSKSGVIMAKNTIDNTWTKISSWSGSSVASVDAYKSVYFKGVDSTNAFDTFRLVITSVDSQPYVTLIQWRLFGTREQGQSILHDGQLTLTKNLDVPRIGPALGEYPTPRRANLKVEFDTSLSIHGDESGGRPFSTSGQDFAYAYNNDAHYSVNDKAFKFPSGTATATDNLYGDHGFTIGTSPAHTHSLWVKRTSYGYNAADYQWIAQFGREDTTGGASAVLFQASSHRISFDIINTRILSKKVIALNRWYHVVCTFSGGTSVWNTKNCKIYIDGVDDTDLDSTDGTAAFVLANGTWVTLGGSDRTARGMTGLISNYKLYDVALTPDEVYTLYKQGKDQHSHHLQLVNTTMTIGPQNRNIDAMLDVAGRIRVGASTVLSFTGQHICSADEPMEKGLIVSAKKNRFVKLNGFATGRAAITIDESLPIVSLSNVAQDKACFGVVSSIEKPSSKRKQEINGIISETNKENGDNRAIVNSVGEGAIWVVNTNGSLESGDYITTSNVPGYGQKQDGAGLMNYTVAKITMDCDFTASNVTVQTIKREETGLRTITEDVWNDLIDYDRSSNTETQYSNTLVPSAYSGQSGYIPREVTTIVDYTDGSNTISVSEWSNLLPETQNTYQSNTFTEIIDYTKFVSTTEWSNFTTDVQNTYSEAEITTYYHIQRGENVLDENGQLQWEDKTGATEAPYERRFITADGTQTDEANAVHIAAFVGCTYHCG
tara:strand:+ start:5136 stop:10190 length:5055 start_codon:yes stop_codon:yes gene_type:complete